MYTSNKPKEVLNGVTPHPKGDDTKELKLKFVLPKRIKKEEDEYPSISSSPHKAPLQTIADEGIPMDEQSNESEVIKEEDTNEREETCLVGKQQFSFPLSLIELGDLSVIFNMDVWKNMLSPDERANLGTLLPPTTSEAQQTALLTKLFSGDNFHFGNPIVEAARALNAGELQEQVVRKMEQLRYAQRSEYIHNLRVYHHKMVDDIIKFRRDLGMADTTHIATYSGKHQAKPISITTPPPPTTTPSTTTTTTTTTASTATSATSTASSTTASTAAPTTVSTTASSPPITAATTTTTTTNGPTTNGPTTNSGSHGVANGVTHPRGITTNVILNGFPMENGFTSTLSGIPLSSITPNSISLNNSISNSPPKLPQLNASVNTPTTTITYIKQQPPGDEEPVSADVVKRKKSAATPRAQPPAELQGLHTQSRPITLVPTILPSVLPLVEAAAAASPVPQEEPKRKRKSTGTPGEKEKKPKAPKKPKVANGDEEAVVKAPKTRKPKAAVEGEVKKEVLSPQKEEPEEEPGPPPVAAPAFLLFFTIRDFFESKSYSATLDEVLACVEKVPLLVTHLPPFFDLPEFVRIALVFLAKPPVLSSAAQNSQTPGGGSGTGITYEEPLVRYDKPTQRWHWLDIGRERLNGPLGDEHLQSLEQLFYFAAARNLTTIDGGVDLSITMNRQQKCILTIEPSTDEMTESFQQQEVERYKVPEKPFVFVINNFKYVVAPMKRGVGKTGNKPRDHFLLKAERPPHINLLCLVRDAAARLPGGVGTRPDVSLLLRDSQYVVESISDTQINTVVSGALDRLHSEKDPCVKFDSEQKLWVYPSERVYHVDSFAPKSRKRAGRKRAEDKEKEAASGASSASPATPSSTTSTPSSTTSTPPTNTPILQSKHLKNLLNSSPLSPQPASFTHQQQSPLQQPTTQPPRLPRMDPFLLEPPQPQLAHLPAILSHGGQTKSLSPLHAIRQQLSPSPPQLSPQQSPQQHALPKPQLQHLQQTPLSPPNTPLKLPQPQLQQLPQQQAPPPHTPPPLYQPPPHLQLNQPLNPTPPQQHSTPQQI